MKYPPLPKKYDARCKLVEKDIKKIRRLRKQKMSLLEIAKLFDVSEGLISYWTNISTNQKVRESARKLRNKSDQHRKIDNKSHKKRKHLFKIGLIK